MTSLPITGELTFEKVLLEKSIIDIEVKTVINTPPTIAVLSPFGEFSASFYRLCWKHI